MTKQRRQQDTELAVLRTEFDLTYKQMSQAMTLMTTAVTDLTKWKSEITGSITTLKWVCLLAPIFASGITALAVIGTRS